MSGGLNFATIFAQFRRHVVELQDSVDILLIGAADALAFGFFKLLRGSRLSRYAKYAVLADAQAALYSQRSYRYVMALKPVK